MIGIDGTGLASVALEVRRGHSVVLYVRCVLWGAARIFPTTLSASSNYFDERGLDACLGITVCLFGQGCLQRIFGLLGM